MQKVAIIVREKAADWVSCRSITRNLAESYSQTEGITFELVPLTAHATQFEMCRVASYLFNLRFNKIIFVEHSPNPCPLVKALAEIDSAYRPELIFHVFGDFILDSPAWFNSEKFLSLFPVQFVCASKKQENLVRTLIKSEPNQIVTIPFPVSTNEFYFDEQIRSEFRKKMGWKENQNVFLYSGRLSSQKNIFLLLKSFEAFDRQFQLDSNLCLAGPIDDLGTPYLGKKSPAGLMNYDIQTLLADFDNKTREKVFYLGDLNQFQLNQLYNGCDIFVSLSTHNDEDFGMAPAEALSTGLFSILSNWGGYTQFNEYAPNNTRLVPVQIQGSEIAPAAFQVSKMMAIATQNKANARKKEASAFQKLISLESVSSKLSENLKRGSRRNGISFTPLFRNVAQRFLAQPKAPFSAGENYSELYKELYDVYRL